MAGEPGEAAVTGRYVERVAVAACVAVVAIAVSALTAIAAVRISHRHQIDDARHQAITAATSSVATVLSYDYRHLSSDFSDAEALLTPRFRAKYVKTTAAAVQPLAAKYHATSTAVVPQGAAGAITVSTDRALVLVFVDQTVTNSQLAAPRLDRARINVTLVHVGGRWLVDNLQPV
jgi:Mce-associated membrane protein